MPTYLVSDIPLGEHDPYSSPVEIEAETPRKAFLEFVAASCIDENVEVSVFEKPKLLGTFTHTWVTKVKEVKNA